MNVGRYALSDRIGGEDSKVWEAELVGPAGFRKRVAIRLLGPEPDALEAVRAAGMLHHPNVVEVYEVDAHEGEWFCAMERVRGGRLDALAPLPPRAVISAALQLCAAAEVTSAGPRMGFGPADVLVDEGVVKLAVIAREHSEPTPPEGWVDDRSAIWAIGHLIRLLATGSNARAAAEVPLFRDIVATCLAADPSARFPSLPALVDALEGIDASGPGLADVTATDHVSTGPVSWSGGPRTNIEPPRPLIGRSDLLHELLGRLGSGRLVTAKGPPGIGKSHLVRVAARMRLDAGTAEAWAVDPGERPLLEAVARVLGVPPVPDDLILAMTDRGELLLVMDPMDRHLDQAESLVGWLGRVPNLKILVGCREPLRVPGEQIVDVRPLAAGALEELAERSGRVVQDVDGLPGALLDPDGLRAALEALRGELSEWECDALAQLASLEGGFTLDRAEQIVDVDHHPDAPWVLDVVAGLVDRSLLVTEDQDGEPGFRMLLPIRAWVRAWVRAWSTGSAATE